MHFFDFYKSHQESFGGQIGDTDGGQGQVNLIYLTYFVQGGHLFCRLQHEKYREFHKVLWTFHNISQTQKTWEGCKGKQMQSEMARKTF